MSNSAISGSSLWATVLTDLRARLAAGEFADRFPSDRELVDHYGVSRHTIREAVRRLDGVERRPRLGGRVRTASTVVGGLLDTLAALGVRTRAMAVSTRKRRSAEIAGRLDRGRGTLLTVQTSVLQADGAPLVCLQIWSAGSDPVSAELTATLLSARQSDQVNVISQRTVPAAPEPAVCEELGIPAGSVTFCIEAHLELYGRLQVWQRAFIRPDRYPCILRFTAT